MAMRSMQKIRKSESVGVESALSAKRRVTSIGIIEMENKPKEFWIQETAYQPIVFYSRREFELHENEMHELEDRPFCDAVHVIEKSAYDKLQAELDEARIDVQKKTQLAVEYAIKIDELKLWIQKSCCHEAQKQTVQRADKLQSRLEKCEALLEEVYDHVDGTAMGYKIAGKINQYFAEVDGE